MPAGSFLDRTMPSPCFVARALPPTPFRLYRFVFSLFHFYTAVLTFEVKLWFMYTRRLSQTETVKVKRVW